MFKDLRFCLRNMNKHIWLSIAVVMTLTLGIGISAGVFGFLDAQILRAHVDKDFDSYVQVYSGYSRDPLRPGSPGNTTMEDFLAFRERSHSLRNVTAWAQVEAPLSNGDPFQVRAWLVSPEFFSLYDLDRPLLGRLLQTEDFSAANPVAVLTEPVWRKRFAADPQIVGKVIDFNGQPVTIVGVTPIFAGLNNGARIFFPYTLQTYLKVGDNLTRPGESSWLSVAARLKPGFSHRDAAAELRLLAGQQDRLHPGRTTTLTVTNGSQIQDPWDGSRLSLAFLVIIVALVTMVLIVSLNVTTLLLARAAARRQEIAVRLAVGATPRRLVRMLLTESLVLAALAGVASYYLAERLPVAIDLWFTDLRYENAGTFYSLAPDWRVFAYLAAATLFAGVMVGLTPALQSLKVNLSEMLKGRQTMTAGTRGNRIFGFLIGAQVALSFFLLYGAVICIAAGRRAASLEPGFETRQVLMMSLAGQRGTTERDFDAFHRTLTERLAALPAVQSVAYAETYPFGYSWGTDVYTSPGAAPRGVAVSGVSPNYFSTLSIPILSGRALQEGDLPCGDSKGSCPVVVSQQFAREFWPNEQALGKTLRGAGGNSYEVVGVARDISMTSLGRVDDPLMYEPLKSMTRGLPYQPIVRFSGDGTALGHAMAANVRALAPEIVVGEVRTIQSIREQSLENLWKITELIGFICILTVLLAVIGIYGVVAFSVSQRTRELGTRIALGAGKKDVYAAVLRSRGRPVAIGLVSGLILSVATLWALTPVLKTAPFAMNVWDPISYGVTAIVLAAVALVAMLIPARRATKVDPLEALRYE
jgi:putative ABC transport system permease protein